MLGKWRWDFRSLRGKHFPCCFAFPLWVHSLVLHSLSTCSPARRPGSLPPSFSVSFWDCFSPLFAPFPRQRPFFMMRVLSHLLGLVGVRICGTLSPGGRGWVTAGQQEGGTLARGGYGGDGGFSETWPESAGQRPGGERVTLSCKWVRGTVWTELIVNLSESPTPSSSSDTTVYALGLTDLCRPPPSDPFLPGLLPPLLLPFHSCFHLPSELWFQSLWLRIVLGC